MAFKLKPRTHRHPESDAQATIELIKAVGPRAAELALLTTTSAAWATGWDGKSRKRQIIGRLTPSQLKRFTTKLRKA